MSRFGWLRVLPFTIALLAQVGCSDSPEPPGLNLFPSSIVVLTPDVQAAHGFEVEIGISSTVATEGVGVAYRAFPKAQYDAHDESIVSYVLGSSVHDVPAGGATFTAQLQVPYETPEGDYYVVPEVDPLNTITETNEEDQYGVKAPLLVNVAHRDEPRLMIEQGALDVPSLELSWATGAPPPPLGLTLLVRAEGDAPVQDAEITACARGPNTGCAALPLGIWDGVTETHQPKLVVAELLPDEPTSIHLDLAFGSELEAVFETLLGEVGSACLAQVTTCAEEYGMAEACAQECVTSRLADPKANDVALRGCLLKCLPFTVEATIDKPGTALFEPPGATPGRSIEVGLQLISPPPVSPVVPQALTVRALAGTIVQPVNDAVLGWIWDRASLDFVADKGACTEPVIWSVQLEPGQWNPYASPGTIDGTDLAATYTPPPFDGWVSSTRVVVKATACGETASTIVTLLDGGSALVLEPSTMTVTAGAGGAVDFNANVIDCSWPGVDSWELHSSDNARLDSGPGTLTTTTDPQTIRYTPPPSITTGPPVTVQFDAWSGCEDRGTATIEVRLPEELAFEKAYFKQFQNDLFGAGVDLYAGGFLDRNGGRAEGRARVPVKVFGQELDLLNVTDHASADPRSGNYLFTHNVDVFGYTVNSMQCPGDSICTGTADLWSDSKCKPDGPPPVCVGTAYDTPCKRSTSCATGFRCMNGVCTKKCDAPDDCRDGNDGFCLGSLGPGPYKKVYVIVFVPVTVEGKVCIDYGFEAKLNLLYPVPNEFSATLGPFAEVGGYASAAAGYSGLLALGVRGEIVLVRDDFYGKTAATIDLVPESADCPHAAGCIQGSLRESVENVLQGGKGKVYLFADYPTLDWCDWYPCMGVSRETLTLANWGSLFEVANQCDWCLSDTDCAPGVSCTGGMCADGRPGLLCKEQTLWVSAE